MHKVLALKYRPQNFKELIGQNIMVETITNSIKLNKLPNAYLLTGIRGVGKTTTARLIAKALNCNENFIDKKSGEYCECNNCLEIGKSKHLDVLEMDAASRTGIDDIRELIDSSKYNPTSAKYKIIILDEVHMLSKQAFNGLLKTLEEPPPHLKFIFATTEVKKIPVTIISRCQRFDLHRVSIKELVENLKKILKVENVKLSDSALILISKASEGSVRDSLSLLDRAIVTQTIENKEVDEILIRKMLGLADRSKVLNLLDLIFKGDQKKSIECLRRLIDEGIEPNNFLNELLEIIYLIQQKQNIGNFDSNMSISESDNTYIDLLSKNVKVSTLIVFWQLILKVLEELSIVSNQILSLEMLVVRLVHLKSIPSYEKILDSLKKNEIDHNQKIDTSEEIKTKEEKKIFLNEEKKASKISKDQIINTIQTKPTESSLDQKKSEVEKVSSFEELINIASRKKEIELKYDLEKNVNLIKFSEGKIDISFNQNLNKNFVRNLSQKLLEWTKNRWVITLSKELGQKTFFETQVIKKKQIFVEEKKSKTYKEFKNIFQDGELIEIKKND